MEERTTNLFYIIRSVFFGFIIMGGFLTAVWFFGDYYEEKALIAEYNNSAGGYYIFYEQNKEKQSEPLLIVKARDFSNDLYVSKYGRDHWRVLEEEINAISGKEQIDLMKKSLLEQILKNHNNKRSPQTLEYRIEPNPSQLWVPYIRNCLKKLF
jgi:hypothetical protein